MFHQRKKAEVVWLKADEVMDECAYCSHEVALLSPSSLG